MNDLPANLEEIRARDARWNFDGAKPSARNDGPHDSWGLAVADRRALLSRIAALEAQLSEREWRPIESAPKVDGEPILIAGGTYGCETAPCEYEAEFSVTGMAAWDEETKRFVNGDLYYRPTVWQPLPQPPKELK